MHARSAVPLVLGSVLACLTPLAFTQQQPQQHPVIAMQDGGVRGGIESIVVPPIPSAPFTATLVTEWTRYTADGGTVTLINQRKIARDSQGRLYEERWLLVPKGGSIPSLMNAIQIGDPTQRTLLNCFVFQHVCNLLRWSLASQLAAANPPPSISGPLPGNRGTIQTVSLGTQMIDNVETTGTRVTTTLNPGAMGNDKPVQEIRETWRSAQLGFNLISIRSGPMVGKQTFTVTELDPNEPDPQFFQTPAGFTVRDMLHPHQAQP